MHFFVLATSVDSLAGWFSRISYTPSSLHGLDKSFNECGRPLQSQSWCIVPRAGCQSRGQGPWHKPGPGLGVSRPSPAPSPRPGQAPRPGPRPGHPARPGQARPDQAWPGQGGQSRPFVGHVAMQDGATFGCRASSSHSGRARCTGRRNLAETLDIPQEVSRLGVGD